MTGKSILILTPSSLADPALAVAACRAGAVGILDLEHTTDVPSGLGALRILDRDAGGPCGVSLPSSAEILLEWIRLDLPQNVTKVILSGSLDAETLRRGLEQIRRQGREVLVEVTDIQEARRTAGLHPDGFVLKGNEAGGRIGPEGTLIHLQRYRREFGVPCWPRGGIGLYTISACLRAGAAGVCLDAALWLLPESAIPQPSKDRIRSMDGSETRVLGRSLGIPFQVYGPPGTPVVERLQADEATLRADPALSDKVKRQQWIEKVSRSVGWNDPAEDLLPVGQDALLAQQTASEFGNLGDFLSFLREQEFAGRRVPLEQPSPLSVSDTGAPAGHGTKDGGKQAEGTKSRPGTSRADRPASDIAIIGMACLLPGAENVNAYWENILNRVCSVREVPPERWDWRLWYDPDPRAPDKCVSKWGGFLDPVPFDPMEFGMPPNSLSSIEPLHLLTLLTVRDALRDAGYGDRPFPRDKTSVILGAGGGIADLGLSYAFRSFLPYLESLPGKPFRSAEVKAHMDAFLPEWTEDSFAGILTNVAAGRVANRFDLGGLNCTVDAACGSSLAALNLAVRELQGGSSEMAIVGGADTMQSPFAFLAFSKTQALTPTGKARCLDENADGIVISEGFGILVLKRRVDAERDGDRIYAVIKAVAGSSDGKAKGLTAPRAEGQMRALSRAYEMAGLAPSTVQLIEAHATGTAAGDKEELKALNRLLLESHTPPKQCAVGSVKSMIGHTKCTAGIASIIKAAMALHHKILPPTIGVETPNPEIAAEESPLYVNTLPRPWIREKEAPPRRAGVSAMGFGGTNFHAVLEEYRPSGDGRPKEIPIKQLPAELFVWDEADRDGLLQALGKFEESLGRMESASMRDLSFTSWRRAGEHRNDPGARMRLGIVAQTREDLRQKLSLARNVLQRGATEPSTSLEGVYYTDRPLCPEGKVVFLLPGQGAQYPDMLTDLSLLFSEIRESIERADRCLAGTLPKPISSYIHPPAAWNKQEEKAQRTALMQTQVAQPAIAAVSMGTFRLLESLGIHPDMLAGHSLGEITAFCAAGCMDEDDLYLLCEARGRLVQEAQGATPGAMAAVLSPPEALQEVLGKHPECWIVNYNGPNQTVLSGSTPVLQEALKEIESKGMTTRLLPVSCAFHSPLIASAGDRLTELLRKATLRPFKKPVFSNTTAGPHPEDPDRLPECLGEHLRKPVRWVEEVRSIHDAGGRVFIEVGPSTILTGLVKKILQGRPFVALSTDRNGKPAFPQILSSLATLFVNGYPLEIDRLYQGRQARRVDLDSREGDTPPGKTALASWRIDGSRNRPPPSLQRMATEQKVEPDRAGRAAQPPPAAHVEAARPTQEPSLPSPQTSTGPTAEGAGPRTPDGAARVVERFQGLMSKFLETQRAVMMAYLNQETVPDEFRVETAPEEKPSLQEGERAAETSLPDPPDETVPTEAPRRLEDAERERPASSLPEETETPASLEAEARAMLLRLISERTGYPQEVIGPDVDLEAELGIDSIKRVEILGELRHWLASVGRNDVEDAMDVLSHEKTVQGILEQLSLPSEPAGTEEPPATLYETGARPGKQEPAAPRELGGATNGNRAKRYRFRTVPVPVNGDPLVLPVPGTLLITEDSRGVASALTARLASYGQNLIRIRSADKTRSIDKDLYEVDLASHEEVRRFVDEVRSTDGPIGGIVHLLPLSPEDGPEGNGKGLWKKRTQQEVKALFYLLQSSGRDLLRPDGGRPGCVLAVTAMGGHFANKNGSRLSFFPGQAGIEGLLKTLSQEWPDIHTRVVDFSLQLPAQQIAEQVLFEIGSRGGPVEVGFDGYRRVALEPERAPLDLKGAPVSAMDTHSVILVTGGARGISFEVAYDLAERYRPRLLLLGRTPPPRPDEDPDTRDLASPAEIKAALIARQEKEGREPRLKEVEALFHRLMKEREVRRNLEALARTGARAEYFDVDVRDDHAFDLFLDTCYSRFGRIDGVIHGAGIIDDRMILDKSPDSFDNVFDTKVNSAFTLARKLRPETLRFLVFFSSVAGCFGNAGQCDYAAANEVLNKLALYLDSNWPARVVSINWGPWETGMVTPELKRQFAKRGLTLIHPEFGTKRLTEELAFGSKGEGEVIISDIEGWSDAER